MFYSTLILITILVSNKAFGEICTNVIVRDLTSTSISITDQVTQDNEFNLHVNTNLKDGNKQTILIRTELLDWNYDGSASPRNNSEEEDNVSRSSQSPGWIESQIQEGGESRISPLHFSVSQSGTMRTWQVPSTSFPQARFAERVMCPLSGAQKLRISVTTDSTHSLRFKLTVSVIDFLLQPNIPRQVTVSPTGPSVLRFIFPEGNGEDNFLLKLTNSSMAACTIVSLQKASQCPYTFHDQESNVKFGSSYQTMLQKSAMTVSRENYPDGFYLILVGKSNNRECYKRHEPSSVELSQHDMNVTIVVESPTKSVLFESLVTDSILFVFVFYVSLGIIFFIVTIVLDRFYGFELESVYGTIDTLAKEKVRTEARNEAFSNIAPLTMITGDQPDGIDHVYVKTDELKPKKIPFKFWYQTNWEQQIDVVDEVDQAMPENGSSNSSPESSIEITTVKSNDKSQNSNLRPWVTLAKTNVSDKLTIKSDYNCSTLDQTCQTLHQRHRQHVRSHMFSWLIVLAGIFYALPAFQLVYNHQNIYIEGGDLDLCYFNFFCMFPFGNLADFGHVFSNVGYIISGLYFNMKVFMRQSKFKKLCKTHKMGDTGVPEQVGIFYALGGALTLEGVLSGIYHICPTSTNFQFDTTFMFLIAVLIFLKLYQYRHADTVLTAQLVFLVIGVALTLEVIGYFTSHPVFWGLFILNYIFFVLVFILKIYLNENSFRRVFIAIYNNIFICCSSKGRSNINFLSLIPCLTVIFINILMAIFFGISQKPGVSRYLLAILMINMLLYEGYYVSRKLHLRLRKEKWRENEGIRMITMIYFFMSILFMAGACYFFIKELKTSAGTAAESRNLNDSCYLLIFDNHDMWHFLSAAGLYQHFMFLLTLEDYNIRYLKKRKFITVF